MAKKTYDLLFKLLLIGDSGVGKTCILFRYDYETFDIFVKELFIVYLFKKLHKPDPFFLLICELKK